MEKVQDRGAGLPGGAIGALACRAASALFRKRAPVSFRLTYWDGRTEIFGEGAPRFAVTIKDPRALRKILLSPDPAFADAYVAGKIEIDGLGVLLDAYHAWSRSLAPGIFSRLRLRLSRASSCAPDVQRSQIQSHYDRGNDFFSLWLDRSRTYSCAYFRRPGISLEEAQKAKIDLVLRKAQLKAGQRLLDIGSGWGALVIEAASRFGASARGITLSRRQFEFANAEIRARGLEPRASVALEDYRALAQRAERFDRVVSVGMLEHVGRKNLRVLLETVRSLLRPGGVCVLHSIMRAKERPISTWIEQRIFPGGYIPSWREVISLLPELDLHLIDDESLRRHYALTLEGWRARFESNLDQVRALGFDEAMIREWRLYLRGAEAAFRTGVLDLHQLVFTSGINNELAMTREPLYPRIS